MSGHKKLRINHGYLFVAPWVLGFLLFTITPIVSNVFLSFTDWNLFDAARFIGFANYRAILFNDNLFWLCLRNTFFWVILTNLIILCVALITAVLLASNFKGNHVVRTIVYLPAILPPVALGVVIGFLYSGSPNGLVNQLIGFFGIRPQGWFQDAHLSLPTAITTMIWFIGTPMLIYLAAIKGISQNYYDSAQIDGANVMQKLFNVTIPLISPAIVFNLVMGVINGWQVYENILPFTTAADTDMFAAYGRDYSLGVYLIHLHERAFRQFSLGYAAALGLILFVIVVVLTALCFTIVYRNRGYYQEFGE